MWTLFSSAMLVVLAAVLLTGFRALRRAAVAYDFESFKAYRALRRWWARKSKGARVQYWQKLRWGSLAGAAVAALLIYAFRFSLLGVVSLLFASSAVAVSLFALRKEEHARSYTQGSARQRRHAARFRASLHRKARSRERRRHDAARDEADRAPRPVREALRTLGLPEGAGPEEVQAAYRQQAMKHHPDHYAQHSQEVQAEQKERFQEVQWARATLDRYYA